MHKSFLSIQVKPPCAGADGGFTATSFCYPQVHPSHESSCRACCETYLSQTNKLCGKNNVLTTTTVRNCNADAGPGQWSQLIGVPAFPDLDLSLIVLAEPNFDQLGDLLAGLDYAFPDAAKIGVCRPDVGPCLVVTSGHVMVWGCVYS